MKIKDELGNRMKEFYETIPKTRLTRRTPVAIRLDGKSFHAFTKGFKKPFDEVLIKSMQDTMKYLCENIQGCALGYSQSDEITLILTDYKKLTTNAWFDYEVQKMCSISASMATMMFNKYFTEQVRQVIYNIDDLPKYVDDGDGNLIENPKKKYANCLLRSMGKGAMFDARCFNIPKEEVCNLVYWRQLDAIRNSIQMVGQANFSHKQLQNKNCHQIQDMLLSEKGINWNDLPIHQQRGSCCIKSDNGWKIDKAIPTFKNENRDYINKLI